MASFFALAGTAAISALMFSWSNDMFHSLSFSGEERKIHNLAIEKYQPDHNKGIEKNSNNYHPGSEQKEKDYVGGFVAIAAIGGVTWYVL